MRSLPPNADARLIAYCAALTPQSLDGRVHIMRRAGDFAELGFSEEATWGTGD